MCIFKRVKVEGYILCVYLRGLRLKGTFYVYI